MVRPSTGWDPKYTITISCPCGGVKEGRYREGDSVGQWNEITGTGNTRNADNPNIPSNTRPVAAFLTVTLLSIKAGSITLCLARDGFPVADTD